MAELLLRARAGENVESLRQYYGVSHGTTYRWLIKYKEQLDDFLANRGSKMLQKESEDMLQAVSAARAHLARAESILMRVTSSNFRSKERARVARERKAETEPQRLKGSSGLGAKDDPC